jgi:hypothetical protein
VVREWLGHVPELHCRRLLIVTTTPDCQCCVASEHFLCLELDARVRRCQFRLVLLRQSLCQIVLSKSLQHSIAHDSTFARWEEPTGLRPNDRPRGDVLPACCLPAASEPCNDSSFIADWIRSEQLPVLGEVRVQQGGGTTDVELDWRQRPGQDHRHCSERGDQSQAARGKQCPFHRCPFVEGGPSTVAGPASRGHLSKYAASAADEPCGVSAA